MKTKPSKNAQNEQDKPHCRSCGGTDIEFRYTEGEFGHEINERITLESACYYLGDAVRGETEGDCDGEQLARIATTMTRLAVMLKVRGKRGGGDAEEATPEMPS
jgi:hypothetical protein